MLTSTQILIWRSIALISLASGIVGVALPIPVGVTIVNPLLAN